jgi:hypothetical protein
MRGTTRRRSAECWPFTSGRARQGDRDTIGMISSYLREHLADASARVAAGFRQVPLIYSVGLDFPIARKVVAPGTQ